MEARGEEDHVVDFFEMSVDIDRARQDGKAPRGGRRRLDTRSVRGESMGGGDGRKRRGGGSDDTPAEGAAQAVGRGVRQGRGAGPARRRRGGEVDRERRTTSSGRNRPPPSIKYETQLGVRSTGMCAVVKFIIILYACHNI